MVSTRKLAEISAPSTCNCLLPGSCAADGSQFDLVAGCYELLKESGTSTNGERYHGCVHGYVCEIIERERCSLREVTSALGSAEPANLPGIFDLTGCSDEQHLMASCTDGAVRLLRSRAGFVEESVFPVHDTMLTSCSPFYLSGGSAGSEAKWLCTAHQGAVIVYDAVTKTAVSKISGHDYDAWCSATTSAESALSGGDDGMLKWWDVRRGSNAVGRMQFDAGVVCIAPIAEDGTVTMHALVGSYDEKLYLIDARFTKQPLASVALGGGVWRCSRQLSVGGLSTEAATAMHYYRWVQSRNILTIPVMQRGVAFVRYNAVAAEKDVFSLLGHLHQEEGSTEDVSLPTNALFYDCAVIRHPTPSDTDGNHNVSTVATCDFYNQKIALWEIDGIDLTV